MVFARLGDIFDRRWLTNDGPVVQELEQRIAEQLGVRHCVAMSNATIALEIVIRALGPDRRGNRARLDLRRDGARPAVAGHHPGVR